MRTRLGLIVALGTLYLFGATFDARADKNIALVIGNSAYQNVARLPNPTNDAAAMAALFRQAGFAVVTAQSDLSVIEMRRTLRDFGDLAQDADIAVVYYAGHGIEVDGSNYLIPIDAALERDTDVEDEAVSLDRVVRTLEPAKRLRLVIVDACRDNPFTRSMKRTLGTRAVTRGLAKVELATSDTLVAFATEAGSTAADGSSRNSPFTAALLRNLATPGLDVRFAFGRVRNDVMHATGSKQRPFVYGSLGGDVVSLVPAPKDENAEARRDYGLAAQVGTAAAWKSFLSTHAKGLYADLARARHSKADQVEQASNQADSTRKLVEDRVKAKTDELSRIEQGAPRSFTEKLRGELDEARRQFDEAKQRAEGARRQVEELKRDAIEEAQRHMEEVQREESERQAKIAALTQPSAPAIDSLDLGRLLQAHLKRVGCDPGSSDGKWDDKSKKALEQFNKSAGTSYDTKVVSLDALDGVRTKTSRVCPLVCGKGQKVDGERCVQISCDGGYVLNSSGTCVKRPEGKSNPVARQQERSAPAASPSSGSQRCFSFNGKRFCE
jgi:uncharacterized caspase-like protein